MEKAKATQKYIFVDCYATWCGPCKTMDNKIYPLESIGEYFNDKFISLKVQMDTSRQDNDEVKNGYADAHDLKSQYQIGILPTFLFFSPEGKLVHRAFGLK